MSISEKGVVRFVVGIDTDRQKEPYREYVDGNGTIFDLRDRGFDEISYHFWDLPEELLDALQTEGLPFNVLDLGGGPLSRMVTEIADQYSLATAYNADPMAIPTVHPRVRIFDSEEPILDLPNDYFQVALSWQFLHYFNAGKELEYLGEISRVLAPGGVAFFDEGCIFSLPKATREEIGKDLSSKLLVGEKSFSSNGNAITNCMNPFSQIRLRNFIIMAKNPTSPNFERILQENLVSLS